MLTLVSLFTINPRINGWNEASRMALTQSLVEQHSLIIDESVFTETGDKVYIDGHYYSDKPAMPSLLASLVYAPLHFLGLKLDYGWNLAYYLIILFTMKLFWIGSILAFRGVLSILATPRSKMTAYLFIYAFASLAFTWSSSFNNHSLAGSSLMIAFYFYLQSKRDGSFWFLILSGLFFGLAASMDIPTAIFLVGFGLLTINRFRSLDRSLLFIAGASLPLLIHFVVNYSIGGTLLPLQINPEFFVFEGSTWTESNELSGVSVNSAMDTLKYSITCLLGPRGFIWYNPLLILLIPLLIKNIRRDKILFLESFTILMGSLILMGYYFLFSSNYGGWSYSIRWFVPILPLLFVYVFDLDAFENIHWYKPMLWGLVLCSIIIAGIGLINPWSNLDLHAVPIIANLKQLLGILS